MGEEKQSISQGKEPDQPFIAGESSLRHRDVYGFETQQQPEDEDKDNLTTKMVSLLSLSL
ncbi:hypothetical protein RchiOBHm_Chr3g0456121 [Rosa chinensis]|uniref:Uncharacterized protein n=1 Tax=Rosa chinensis TaxID=74649 RepID=A0A2P6R7B9_ROSCH|nr:hypothetical protein RchiOBHm_Chr3g0456121 [Rosa chinensis]